MASKTVARSRGRTSRSKTASRRGSWSARPRPKPARRPAKAPRRSARRRQHSLLTSAGLTCGRAVRATWLMVARGTGTTARSVGRARDIDPGHRRDGIALALLGLAVVIAASSWFDAARPVGAWIDSVLRVLIGSAVVLLPVVTAAVAVLLMRTEPDPDARPRLVLGAAMVTLPLLGLWHLWAGSPDTPVGRAHAAGFVGFAIGGPLAEGLTPWICRPAAVHRRALRAAAVDRHDDPRGARHDACHVRHPDVRRGRHRAGDYDDDLEAKTGSPKTSPTATTTTLPPTATTKRRRGRPAAEDNHRYRRRAPTVPEPAMSRGRRGAKAAAKVARPGRRRARTRCRRWIC